MNKTKTISKKVICIIVAAVLSCFVFTACGHTLSGKYKCNEGFSLSFESNGDCRMYYDSSDTFIEGTYEWDSDLNCYFLEFKETSQGNIRFRAESEKDRLYVTIHGEEFIFNKV